MADPEDSPRIPHAVQRRLVEGQRRLAWLRLEDGVVRASGGALRAHGLDGVVHGRPLPATVEWAGAIEGPLPFELRALDVPGGPLENEDVFVWEDEGATFVLLANADAEVLREKQLRGNVDEFLRERLAGAERLRRSERRSRAVALAALGYELLEEGPDGAFRPTSEPQHWLSELCGWSAADARVLAIDDPIDFLSAFLGEARSFFAASRAGEEGRRSIVSSGVWTEVLPLGPGGALEDTSFEAHAIAQPEAGPGLVAVERLDSSMDEKQTALQKRRDAQLSLEGLAREVEIKDVLLHCIVHDLRGPLASIAGALGLLAKGDLDAPERAELIEVGLRQARRQEQMIDGVLDLFAAEYAALQEFEVDPETAPDLVAIARETCARQSPAFEVEGVRLEADLPASRRRIKGRADRLERVLANLLGNARRHAAKGTSVELRVRDLSDGACEVAVLDRGPGVAKKLRPRLFRRFVQGGGGGAAGLGLYYVAMTVERWGGAVRYEDRAGGGAAFYVTLPRA